MSKDVVLFDEDASYDGEEMSQPYVYDDKDEDSEGMDLT
jgi:hypothetical protein